MRAFLIACAAAVALSTSASERRAVAFDDLPPAIQQWLRGRGIEPGAFPAYVRAIALRSAERRDAGAREHLIYFILQSTRFTRDAPIEPALSASAFVGRLLPAERERLLADATYVPPVERIPTAAVARLRAFQARAADLSRRSASQGDRAEAERMGYFARLLPNGADTAYEFLTSSYTHAMRFLYLKEFAAKNASKPVEQENIARLYQERGYNTDTGFEANYAVDVGLNVIASLSPGERRPRVLIVGPGLDLAPRTDLVDAFPPQSYQPYAVADSLIRAGLASAETLDIHCVDVNDAVVDYVSQVREGKITRLSILSGVPDRSSRPLSEDYRRYFREFGRRIGAPVSNGARRAGFDDRLYTSVQLDPRVAGRIGAERFDIITERYARAAPYDLVVVTNVLTYFDDTELALALANIASLLRAGGMLVHNEVRPALEPLASAAGLPAVQMRSVIVAPSPQASLYDTVWIHRR